MSPTVSLNREGNIPMFCVNCDTNTPCTSTLAYSDEVFPECAQGHDVFLRHGVVRCIGGQDIEV